MGISGAAKGSDLLVRTGKKTAEWFDIVELVGGPLDGLTCKYKETNTVIKAPRYIVLQSMPKFGQRVQFEEPPYKPLIGTAGHLYLSHRDCFGRFACDVTIPMEHKEDLVIRIEFDPETQRMEPRCHTL